MHRILPTLLLTAALVPAASATAAVRTEPVSPPGVRVHLEQGALTVSGAARPGPLRLTLTGEQTASVAIIELAPGHTAAELGDVAGLEDPAAVERIGRLVAGATVWPDRVYRTTITAHQRDYVAVDVSSEDGPRTTFRVAGAPVAAPLPRADARITMTDDGFDVPKVLPARGVLRVENAGRLAHHALALRIRAGLSTAEAVRLATHGGRPMAAGTPIDLVGVVSAGTTNRVQVRLRPGRYLLMSLTGDHTYATTRVR